MKLSEMSTRQLAAALCKMTEPVANIAGDGELNGVFVDLKNKMKDNAHMTTMQKVNVLLGAVPVLLVKHYDDVAAIMAAMTGKSAKEVDEMNGFQMIAEMRESIDEQLLSFFKSSAVMEKIAKGADE